MGQTQIYGVHAVKEAITSGKDLIKIQIQKEVQNNQIDEIISLCRNAQIPLQYVPREKFYTLKDKNHQGVVGFISPISYYSLEQIVPGIWKRRNSFPYYPW